ncbi:MAG: hypothetical protein GXP34_10880 [Actinobacteria bacterium]|nr:hypothetical protein [Actinomycetota bacterium]
MSACNPHEFREHAIGARLTRKVCVVCGAIRIGQQAWSVGLDPWRREVAIGVRSERLALARWLG